MQFLTVKIDTQEYAIPLSEVREINSVGQITPIPKTPPFVKGVINLRGKILPIVGLRAFLGISEVNHTRDACIVVVDTDHGSTGLLVDAVSEVISIDPDNIDTGLSSPNLGISGVAIINGKSFIVLIPKNAINKTNLQ